MAFTYYHEIPGSTALKALQSDPRDSRQDARRVFRGYLHLHQVFLVQGGASGFEMADIQFGPLSIIYIYGVGGMPRIKRGTSPARRDKPVRPFVFAQDRLGGGATGVNLCPMVQVQIGVFGVRDILLAEL